MTANMHVQLHKMFSNETLAREYLEYRRWKLNIKCPDCFSEESITKRKGAYYRCNKCKIDFTVRTGTIFKRSHIKLNKLVHFFYLLVTSTKRMSSTQISRDLCMTQKTAWLLLKRFRKVYGDGDKVYTNSSIPLINITRELNHIADKIFRIRAIEKKGI